MEENYERSKLSEELEQDKMHKGRLADLSPEEARLKAKESVAKGMALGTGAIEGYVQNADPKVVGDATRAAAKTVSNTVKAVKEERQQGLPGEPIFHRKADASMGTRSDMSHSSGGFSEKKEHMKEAISERASGVREKANLKAHELADRSKESYGRMREEMKKRSPDEIRQKARDSVGRVVASGTGALEGVAENADPDLPTQAVHKISETVREAGGAVREEVKNARSGGSRGSSSSAISSEDENTSGGI